MKVVVRSIVAALVLALPIAACAQDETKALIDQVFALEAILGGYPPRIKNEDEAKAVKLQYQSLKSTLDGVLMQYPKDESALFLRGYLQSMGHNADYPGAWQGATDDFKALLRINPANIRGNIELARLWVNSNASLAPNAEKLFLAAQCLTGSKPNEDVQKGLFFALYYQGKMNDALRQAKFLTQAWPTNQEYQSYYDMALKVVSRDKSTSADADDKGIKVAMATCSK
ncbi:MAG: hypothetical protein HY016_04505 [Nitrosomonadales bacterium]|nr:hypothetical protein [Nitrosomonadales bacterium]